MPKIQLSTTESVLESLKLYLKENLKDRERLVSTVKAGIVDERDELPMIMVLPVSEIFTVGYSGGLIKVDRNFRIDIVDKAFGVEEVKNSIKKRMIRIKDLFSIRTLGWNLPNALDDNILQCDDFELGRETLDNPVNDRNSYTQFGTIPLTLKGYIQIDNPELPDEYIEYSYLEFLDYLFEQTKDFKAFQTRWRDVTKPLSLENYPALGVFISSPDEDKENKTSTEITDINVIYRIYSTLATKEIAFTNHVRNVETVKNWILNHSSLNGCVEHFGITSIDYGIDAIPRAFQGESLEVPTFRSDISVIGSLISFKES